MHTQPDQWRFGTFVLDLRRRALLADGKDLKLPGRAFDLLAFLVLHRDEPVGKDTLVREVWRGLAVSDNNLAVQISTLRHALAGAQAGADTLIVTVPGLGYRFVGDATPETPLPPAAPVRAQAAFPRPRAVLGRAVPAALFATLAFSGAIRFLRPPAQQAAPPLSIVVLPFRTLGDGKAQQYLADAVTDDLTADLARIPGSLVIARETAETYKGHAVPVTEIGHTLGVHYLLEGSVATGGARLHVNARLIDTATGACLWALPFDMQRDRLADGQDDIAHRIAAGLDTALAGAETARAQRERPNNPDALDLFFRARSVIDRDDTLAGLGQAQSLLERAVAMQPDFTDAWSALGALLLRKAWSVEDPQDERDFAAAQAAIRRALSLAPRDAGALAAQGKAYAYEGRYTDAVYSARAALAIDANNDDGMLVLAICAYSQGRLEDAVAPLQTLLRRNPAGAASKSLYLKLGTIRLLQGRIAEAIDLLHQGIAGDPAPVPGADRWGAAEAARLLLIGATALAGDLEAARRDYAFYAGIWPHRTVWRVGALAPKFMGALPGFKAFLAALHQAGMPLTADENADDHAGAAGPLPDDYFAPTPPHVDGAQTLGTAQMQALVNSNKPRLIIDLGTRAAAIEGAVWEDIASTALGPNAFVDKVLRDHRRAAGEPVVIMADGPYGSAGYNAVLHLVASGEKAVFWYRGGEEAWAASGMPAFDRRQQ
jgi:TolB-like protein/DNA-binding winged helix-turn-helix (wHTH) protein